MSKKRKSLPLEVERIIKQHPDTTKVGVSGEFDFMQDVWTLSIQTDAKQVVVEMAVIAAAPPAKQIKINLNGKTLDF